MSPDSVTRLAVVEHLDRALAGRPVPGRPVPPDKWHLTLRFLGDSDDVRYERVLAQLDQIDWPSPFRLGLGSLGAFPRPSRATVLWLGVTSGETRLTEIAGLTEEAVQAAGFPAEERPFHPHLTLSRIRPHQDVRGTIDAVPPANLVFSVDRVIVYRSHLGRGGARYEALEEFPFERV